MSGGSSRRYPPELRERAVRMVAEISDLGFPRNRGGFLYAASGWMAAIFSYSTGGSNPAELWRRRVL
jgi:hypothetical protein